MGQWCWVRVRVRAVVVFFLEFGLGQWCWVRIRARAVVLGVRLGLGL